MPVTLWPLLIFYVGDQVVTNISMPDGSPLVNQNKGMDLLAANKPLRRYPAI